MSDLYVDPEEEQIDSDEEEATYVAFLYDKHEDEDFKDYELLPDDEERRINWDDDEYEYYHDDEDDDEPSRIHYYFLEAD